MVRGWMRMARRFLVGLLALSCVWCLAECGAAAAQGGTTIPPLPGKVSLGIVGYNYTNRYIDAFSVDGAGGGNLFVSSPTSGGGGTVCCTPYFPGIRTLTVTVRWQAGACIYHTRSADGTAEYKHIYSFFKEADVEVEKPLPADAKYLEVHFYPDGGVKAVLTTQASLPRLQLPSSREDRSPYPGCPDDKQPKD